MRSLLVPSNCFLPQTIGRAYIDLQFDIVVYRENWRLRFEVFHRNLGHIDIDIDSIYLSQRLRNKEGPKQTRKLSPLPTKGD